MAVFPLLADPESYRACDTDLLTDHAARAYWLNLFDFYLRLHLDAKAMSLILRACELDNTFWCALIM